MYLCNLKITGKGIPDKIPENIMNEVSSMVDIISFGVPDSAPTRETPKTNVPNFEVTPPAAQTAPGQPPQSNLQTLATLQPQPTVVLQQPAYGSLSAQATGFTGQLSPQRTGFTPPTTRFQAQAPGLGVPPQFSSLSPSPALGLGGVTALHAQPTGQPGQWGFVNAPAGSMAGIQALQAQLMPQPSRQGEFSSVGLQGTANVPWAITKDEKSYQSTAI
jgi:actin cytoskeleton-regulatory complex protein PAN1